MSDGEPPRFDSNDDHTVYWVGRFAAEERAADELYRGVADIATRRPFEVADRLWREVRDRRRQTRRYFVGAFGYDPARVRCLLERRRDRWPRIRERWDEWLALDHLYTRDGRAIERMMAAARKAVSEKRDPFLPMVMAWIDSERHELTLAADRIAPWGNRQRPHVSAVWLAGYARAHLSLSRNKRLYRALGPGDRAARERKLALALPAAVAEAWTGGAARGDIAKLPLEAARIIEGNAERKYRRRGREPEVDTGEIARRLIDAGHDRNMMAWLHRRTAGRKLEASTGDDTPRADELQEVALREQAARCVVDDFTMAEAVRRLTRDHGLSAQQARVAYLAIEHPQWRLREIGGALGIAEGTVKRHRYDVRRRLRLERSS